MLGNYANTFEHIGDCPKSQVTSFLKCVCVCVCVCVCAVSYTHLDVYKRQGFGSPNAFQNKPGKFSQQIL